MIENQVCLPPSRLWPLATELDKRRQNRQQRTGETGGKRQALYFIQADAFVKIGLAINIQKRMHQIAVGCPFPLTLIDLVDGDREFERRVHEDLKEEHVRGEWFRWRPTIEGLLLTSVSKPQIKTSLNGAHFLDIRRSKSTPAYLRQGRYATTTPALLWDGHPQARWYSE